MNAHDVIGIAVFLVVLGILTLGARYGVDSRDGNDWRRSHSSPRRQSLQRPRRRLSDDLTAMARRVCAAHRRQVELHERFLDRQRPWLGRRLRWEGSRLSGSVLPPADPRPEPADRETRSLNKDQDSRSVR